MKHIDEVCPMFGDKCRFCSEEIMRETVHFGVIKDCDLGKKGELGKKIRRTNLGYFCNNDGKHFVKDMKYCPARFALTRPVSKEAQVMVDELVKTNFGKVVKKPLKKVKRSVKKPVKKPVKKMVKKR